MIRSLKKTRGMSATKVRKQMVNFISYLNPYRAGTEWLAIATSIEPGQPAHLCSLWPGCITVGWPSLSSNFDIPTNDNGMFQKWKNCSVEWYTDQWY